MLQRIFMYISRGMTDKTAVCVFPWEKPLVEEIHGGQAVVVTIDEMCSKDGVAKVQDIRKVVRLPKRKDQDGKEMIAERGLNQREQLELMQKVAPEDNPMHDLEGEWGRMIEKYGPHPEVKTSVAEKVYGRVGNFRLCCRDFAAGRVPAFLADNDEDTDLDTEHVEAAPKSKKKKAA